MKRTILYTVVIIISLTIIFLPYILVFDNGFSDQSSDWANFGSYLSGMAGIANLFVFIGISILLNRLNTKNNKFELKFNRQKEIFTRFLTSYENLIVKIYMLKVYLAEMQTLKKELDIKKLLEFYKEIKTLEALSKSYFNNEKILEELANFMNNYSALLASVSTKEPKDIISDCLKALIKSIDDLVDSLSEYINNFLNETI